MFTYFSESKDGTTEAMKEATKKILNGNKSDYDKMKTFAKAYMTYKIWLRKVFPPVIFLNRSLPENAY